MSYRKMISEIKLHVTAKFEISPYGRHPPNWNCFYCFKKNQTAKTDWCQIQGIHSWIYCARSKNGQKIPRGKRVAREIMITILAKHLFSVLFCDKWATVSGAWWPYAVSFLLVWVLLLIPLSFLSFHTSHSLWSHSCEWGPGDLCWEALPWKCSGSWGWVVWNFLACFDLYLFSDQEISADSLLRSLRWFVQWHSEISNEFDQWATRERTQDGDTIVT